MTIAVVAGQAGGNNANSATSVTRAFGSNVTAGSLIVIVGTKSAGSSDAFVEGDCTKSAGTSTVGRIGFARGVQIDLGGGAGFGSTGIWWCVVIAGGSLTMSVGGAPAGSSMNIATDEYTGDWGNSGARVEAGNSNSSATDGSSPGTTGNASSLGEALFVAGLSAPTNTGTLTITPDAAFTQIYEEENATANNPASTIRRIVTSTTTDQGEWTMSGATSNGWTAVVSVLRERINVSPLFLSGMA